MYTIKASTYGKYLLLLLSFALLPVIAQAQALSVSNMSGQVSYSYPISGKTVNGSPFNVSLNYSSSVAYGTFGGYIASDDPSCPNCDGWGSFARSHPAWIIGVNEFAVQVLSTTSGFNQRRKIHHAGTLFDRDEAADQYRQWLVTGYDYSNRMKELQKPYDQDLIQLLKADGSILELRNPKQVRDCDSRLDPSLYTGRYYVNGLNNNGFGIVDFDTTTWWPSYIKRFAPGDAAKRVVAKPRVLRYYPGDGLEYVFREHVAPYGLWYMKNTTGVCSSDLSGNYTVAGPTIFYLEEINDGMRTLTSFTRSRHMPTETIKDSTVGRALITGFNGHKISYGDGTVSIEALGRTINLKYKVKWEGYGFVPSDLGEGQYSLIAMNGYKTPYSLDKAAEFPEEDSQVGFITEITEPVRKRKTTFSYDTASRQVVDYQWPQASTPGSRLWFFRLSEVKEPDARFTLTYHPGTTGFIRRDSVRQNAGKKIDYDLFQVAKQVNKYAPSGQLLVVANYDFDNYPSVNGYTGFDRRSTLKLTDTVISKRTVTDYLYRYQDSVAPYNSNPDQPYLNPYHKFLAPEKTITKADSITTTSITRFANNLSGSSRFFFYPVVTESYIQKGAGPVLRAERNNIEYTFAATGSFSTTSLNDAYGRTISTQTVKTYSPDDTVNVRLQVNASYSQLNYQTTVLSRTDSTWDERRSDSLTQYWRQRGKDTTVIVYTTQALSNQLVHLPPKYMILSSTLVKDGSGNILSGQKNNLNLATPGNTVNYPYGALVSDTLIGENNVKMLNGVYSYTGGTYRNMLAAAEDNLGARSLMYYDYFRVPGRISYPTGTKLLNSNATEPAKLSRVFHHYEQPLAERIYVRKYDNSGTLKTDTLTSYVERSFYGNVTGAVDYNGWYYAQDYDENGRPLTIWHPYDFPPSGSSLNRPALQNCSEQLRITTTTTTGIDTLKPTRPTYPIEGPTNTSYSYDELVTQNFAGRFPHMRDTAAFSDTETATSVRSTATLTYIAGSADAIHVAPSIQSAKLNLHLASVVGESVTLKVDIPQLNATTYHTLNANQLSKLPDAVSAPTATSNPMLSIDLMPHITYMKLMSEGSELSFNITTLTTNSRVEIATKAPDVVPAICVVAQLETDPHADYTFAYSYDDSSRVTTFSSKIDDASHTTTGDWSKTYSTKDGRYTGSKALLGADGRVRAMQNLIGNPASPDRIDSVVARYTGLGRMLSMMNPYGDSTRAVFDALGRTLNIFNADNSHSEAEYEIAAPSSFSISDPDFGGICKRIITKDEAGRRTARFYDAFGRLRREVDDYDTLQLTTKYEYDIQDRLVKVINPRNDTTQYWYDAFGRLKYKYQSDIGHISYSYDKVGNLRFSQTQLQADSAKLSFYQYDDMGRQVIAGEAKIDDPLLDNESLVASGGKEKSRSSLLMAAPSGRLTDLVDPDVLHDHGNSAILTSNKTLWTSASSPSFNATLDTVRCLPPLPAYADNVTPAGPYMRHVVQYYNPQLDTCNIAGFENIAYRPGYVLSASHYDTLPYCAGAVWANFPAHATWDALTPHGSVRNLKGRQSAAAYRDHSGLPFHYVVMSYDERGRVEALVRYTENLGYDAVYYTYNSMNQVLSVRAVDPIRQYATWYSYDKNGRLDTVWSKLSDPGQGLRLISPQYRTAPTKPATADIVYFYDKLGRIDSVSHLATGTGLRYNFNKRGWLDSMIAKKSFAIVFSQAFTRDSSGMITQQNSQQSGQSLRQQSYAYDRVRRLTGWTASSVTTSYVYDVVGNRTSLNEGGTTTSYVYDTTGGRPNRLLSHTTGTDITSFSYNSNGAVTSKIQTSGGVPVGNERFDYTPGGLVWRYRSTNTIIPPDCTPSTRTNNEWDWRYRYSPIGREQKRAYYSPSGDSCGYSHLWEYYLLGAYGEQLVTYQGRQAAAEDTCATTDRSVYLYAIGYQSYVRGSAPLITRPDGTKESQITDNLGSVRATVTSTNTVAGYDFKPFGGLLWSSSGGENRFGFIGQTKDKESKLGDFGPRKYDENTGRFFSTDPLADWYPSLSPYHYSANSPLNYRDPSGMAYQIEFVDGVYLIWLIQDIEDDPLNVGYVRKTLIGVRGPGGGMSGGGGQNGGYGNSGPSGGQKGSGGGGNEAKEVVKEETQDWHNQQMEATMRAPKSIDYASNEYTREQRSNDVLAFEDGEVTGPTTQPYEEDTEALNIHLQETLKRQSINDMQRASEQWVKSRMKMLKYAWARNMLNLNGAKIDYKQAEKKYQKHAKDFGVNGNKNHQNVQLFIQKIKEHLTGNNITVINGAYRNSDDLVFFFFNEQTKNVVILNLNGEFITGYKTNSNQEKSIKKDGWAW